jgi:type I restriction enzyme R subunit
MITDINSEDRLVQATFADYLRDTLGWDSIYAYNSETFGPEGTLGRANEREVVLVRELRAAMVRLNPGLPEVAREQAIEKLTRVDYTRSLVQHNREFYAYIRDGVPVEWRDAQGETCHAQVQVIDFHNGSTGGVPNNRFLAVRELKIQGLRTPHYNRRADLVCFVNGLPVVFIELKAVYRNIRAGFDDNLTDYLSEHSIQHAFHHNAFLVVSNGHRARYGSITSKWEHFAEWKRNDEKEAGRLEAQVLLDGMLAQGRLLDLLEHFILFDDSRAGGTRKIVARNHQVLGVNKAVASVIRQEELKKLYPVERRLVHHVDPQDRAETQGEAVGHDDQATPGAPLPKQHRRRRLETPLVERAHPDLGRLGVFWHTQGSGKSYSMAFFTEKVRRTVKGNFTFVIMTDREDLDDQIFRTFVGCGVADDKTPRAGSGKELERLLRENHRFIFTLIQKFRREKPPEKPYSERDDIIVISDEAHRTQAGKLARNMRLALPNASFIGFTGTPLFKHDHLTRRIFGGYVSRYDFKRSEEDHSTVRLVYENRGEKLGIARLDLNDRIAQKVEEADLDPDQTALLEKLLGKDYEVITADDRLDKLADDFVEHCSKRWKSGKSMLVCIDKITCARMFQRVESRWQAKIAQIEAQIPVEETALAAATDPDERERLAKLVEGLRGRGRWMRETIIEIIISEAQNEVRDFAKWGFDIIPHREIMKKGFETPDGKRVEVDDAFKDPDHPFRIAIVCAMWLTGFDVECLTTLYLDKPMKAHTLMQAIARANRVYPGKDRGVIVDYNGMLKSLRAALAQYALGDEEGEGDGGEGEGGHGEGGGDEIVTPIEELVLALLDAIEATEDHLRGLGFEPDRLRGAEGFPRIEALRDAVDALYTSDEAKRRFEIMAREVFARFRVLIMEPSAYAYAERHDNIEAIYKKLEEQRDTSDVTAVLKELHKIVNEAIRAQEPGQDHAEGLTVDLSRLDFAKLRDEFCKVKRKHTAVQEISVLVKQKLEAMLAKNPLRMDYYKKYQEIIADYNREKDRATVEATFTQLAELASSLDAEQRRVVEEGLSEDEYALFELLSKEDITKTAREQLKQASRSLLTSLRDLLATMPRWTINVTTQAEVEVFIRDYLWSALPRPPFSDEDAEVLAKRVYDHVWQQSLSGEPAFAV